MLAVDVVDQHQPKHPEQRLRSRIAERRDQARYLVDEIFDLEGQRPPEHVCPGCGQDVRAAASD